MLRLGVIVEPLVHRSEGVRRQHVLLRTHALPVSPPGPQQEEKQGGQG